MDERRPLLAENDDADDGLIQAPKSDDSFVSRLFGEPLTELTRLLLFVSVGLLLLASVFIGLFAGAEHRLSGIKHVQPSTTTKSVTSTATATVSTTYTVTATSTPTHKPGPPRPDICTSPECVILAASILSGMNTTADPCEDFYEYANGAWIQDHQLPSGKSRYGVFDQLEERNNLVVQRTLNNPTKLTNAADVQLLKKLKDYYVSCTNEKELDSKGSEPLLEVTRRIRTLFPVRQASAIKHGSQAVLAPKYAHELTSVLAYLHSISVQVLFEIGIDGDAGVDPDFMILWISQSELGLPSKEYYKDPDSISVYGSALQSILYHLDESDSGFSTGSRVWPPWPWPQPDDPPKENRTARAERLSQEIISFESELVTYGADRDTLLVDPIATYNPRPLNNLTKHLSSFMDFPGFVSSFAPRNFPEKVIVTYPSYFENLESLVERSSAEVLQAYFISQAALQLAPFLGLNTELWRVVGDFNQVLNGIKKGTPIDREKWCLEKVQEGLGFMAGRFFVNEVFGPSARQKAFDLIHYIVTAFNSALPNLGWMAPKDREAAAAKASALRIKVGYPLLSPNMTNPLSVDNYYRLVRVSPDEFFSNVISSRMSDQVKDWYRLGKQRDKESWEMYPSQVNAYYNPPANEIVFPAGILRPPFFGEHWPDYLSYGAIGAVVAHELTHAFDSAGRLYNQQGKLETWWSNSTSEEFEIRKECLAKQYSSYTVEDGRGGKEHINGNLTSGENIGDSGLIHSWRAWKANSNNATEHRLPGLDAFTTEQLFFIAFGRVWASRSLPGAQVLRARTDPHSPPLYRVHGTLSNIPEFAETFNCSAEAKLNPSKRCSFW